MSVVKLMAVPTACLLRTVAPVAISFGPLQNFAIVNSSRQMLMRIHSRRTPCIRSNRSCRNIKTTINTRQYTSHPPTPPPSPENNSSSTIEDTDSEIPATWPSKPPSSTQPEEPRRSTSTLLDLLPLYKGKVPGSTSKHVSAFLPQTEKAFYPQPQQVLLDARSTSTFLPRNLDPSTEEPSLRIYIHNTSKETHITVTNAMLETVMVVSIEQAKLKDRTGEMGSGVGSMATTEEAVRNFVERYPFVLGQARVELTLRGFGPGKLDGLTKVLGPLGNEIRDRMTSKSKDR